MAITDYDAYIARLSAFWQSMAFYKQYTAQAANRMTSLWTASGSPASGAVPGVAAVCTNATVGALAQANSSGTQRLLRALGSHAVTAGSVPLNGSIMIVDRIAHNGGMGATNLANSNGTIDPTSRYPTGVGVEACFEIYTTIGATQTTASIQATTDNNATVTSTPPILFGGTGFRETGRAMHIPLPTGGGGRGFKSLTTIALAASTGTDGAYGVTAYYPLVQIPLALPIDGEPMQYDALWEMGCWFPTIPANACVSAYYLPPVANVANVSLTLNIAED